MSTIELSEYLVVFVDVLGQRQRLRGLRTGANDSGSRETALEAIRGTYGVILALRKCLQQLLQSDAGPSEIAAIVPVEVRAAIRRCRPLSVSHRSFSDSILIYVALRTENELCNTANSILHTLRAVAGMSVMGLSQGISIRGGAEVGLGVDIGDGEIYGPALERAYTLESEVALWPRIAIGEDLKHTLEAIRSRPASTPCGLVAQTMAEAASNAIVESPDGPLMLDFLGPSMFHSLNQPPREVVGSAFRFVSEEERQFERRGNAKLAARYRALREYMEKRMEERGV